MAKTDLGLHQDIGVPILLRIYLPSCASPSPHDVVMLLLLVRPTALTSPADTVILLVFVHASTIVRCNIALE